MGRDTAHQTGHCCESVWYSIAINSTPCAINERRRNGTGMLQEWSGNGNGTGIVQEWSRNGVEMVQEWNTTGMAQEWSGTEREGDGGLQEVSGPGMAQEWNKNGAGMVQEWNGTGMAQEC